MMQKWLAKVSCSELYSRAMEIEGILDDSYRRDTDPDYDEEYLCAELRVIWAELTRRHPVTD